MGLEGYKRPLEWLLLLCWRNREATRKLYEQKSESLSILKTINNSGCTAENGVVGTKSEIKETKQGAVLLTQARNDSFLNRSKVNQPMTFRYKEGGRWKDCLWNFYITEIMAGIVIQNETVIQVIHFEEMRESRPEDCRDLLQEWGVNSLTVQTLMLETPRKSGAVSALSSSPTLSLVPGSSLTPTVSTSIISV